MDFERYYEPTSEDLQEWAMHLAAVEDLHEKERTMKTQKAIWYGDGQFPQNGARGTAWPAFGFNDPESPEHGAYCFLPDDFTSSGDEEGTAYYCDPDKDLEFV